MSKACDLLYSLNNIKLKLVDINGDSLIFHDSQKPIISFRGILGLIENNMLSALYSFNPSKYNFNKEEILIYQIIRDSIDLMVKDLINSTINNLKIYKIIEWIRYITSILKLY